MKGTVVSEQKAGDPERWLRERLQSQDDARNGVVRWFGVDIAKFKQMADDVPEFWYDDCDDAYRDGFEDGFDYCLEQVEELYRKRGFVRVREIANILWKWSDTILRYWRYHGEGKYNNDRMHHPCHKFDSTWSEIRARILSRDKCCVRCRSIVQLEVDHIIDVQHGGLPEDDNLQVLCSVCHKAKRKQSYKGN